MVGLCTAATPARLRVYCPAMDLSEVDRSPESRRRDRVAVYAVAAAHALGRGDLREVRAAAEALDLTDPLVGLCAEFDRLSFEQGLGAAAALARLPESEALGALRTVQPLIQPAGLGE